MKKDNKDKIYTCHGCDYYYCDTFNGIREKYPTRHCDYKSHRDCWFKAYQKGDNETKAQ